MVVCVCDGSLVRSTVEAYPLNPNPNPKDHGDACILNITAEFFQPPFFAGHAAAAKMAVDSLTRSHSLEWADYGIRVNGIAPGPIADTPGYDKLAGMGGGDPTVTGVKKEVRVRVRVRVKVVTGFDLDNSCLITLSLLDNSCLRTLSTVMEGDQTASRSHGWPHLGHRCAHRIRIYPYRSV